MANLKKYAAQNLEISASSEGKIVFIGDSITEFWKSANPAFFEENSFINRGISGETSSQMLLRFQNDVLNLKPSIVIILAGINDIAENNGPISLEDILKNSISMIELSMKNNCRIILCSVLPANKFSWRPDIFPAQKILQLNEMIKSFAENNNIVFADFYTEMVDENYGLQLKFGADGVHPNLKGYKVMEPIILEAIRKISD